MLRRGLTLCAVLTAASCAAAISVRAANYSEFVSGDLSLNTSAPTTLSLGLGSNLLTAQSSLSDGDLLRLVVPAGATLNSIVVEFHDTDTRVFAGLQSGATWSGGTGSPEGDLIDESLLLGWVDFPTDLSHENHAGEDILDDIAFAPTPPRFTAPLGSGSYTMLFRSHDTAVNYALSFVVGVAGAIPGDFDHNGSVNAVDLDVWQNAMVGIGVADANGDGVSGGADFLIWQRHQGQSSVAAAASIPEPAAGALLSPLLVALARHFRRRGIMRTIRTASWSRST